MVCLIMIDKFNINSKKNYIFMIVHAIYLEHCYNKEEGCKYFYELNELNNFLITADGVHFCFQVYLKKNNID